jgi:hypothetical protein
MNTSDASRKQSCRKQGHVAAAKYKVNRRLNQLQHLAWSKSISKIKGAGLVRQARSGSSPSGL